MTIDAAPVSLWDRSAEEPDHDAPLREGETVDVAIVGGGFTGLSTALHAAQKGLDCLVLEAHRIGHGGSGRNVGLVNAGVWHPPAAVRKTLGPTYGPRFVERFGDAPAYVFDLIEKHQIRCEPTREGTLHAAHSASGMRSLEGRHKEWSRLGAPIDLLDAKRMAEVSGTRAYAGGLLDRRAGTINPMGYVRGLARAAHGAGARIATGVLATKLAREGGGWVVETSRGPVRARFVILGTNAYTDTLWPGLKDVFIKLPYFQLATIPLGARADTVLPGRHGMWDTALIMTSLRKDAHGRLFIGSMGRIMGDADSGPSRRWAAKRLRQLYPDLGPVEFEQAWHGEFAMTPDHLPRILKLDENLYTPIGYNGRGITTGTIFGKAMADLLTGTDPSELPLPIGDMARVPANGLRSAFYRAGLAANQIVKGI